MKVLLTGATGFIGSHLAESFAARGHQVRALVRDRSRAEGLVSSRVEILVGSLEETARLEEAAAGVDLVVHAAARLFAPSASSLFRVNASGTRALAEAASRAGVGRFLSISSLSAGGPSRPGCPRREAEPDAPVSHYGRSKKAGEEAVLDTFGAHRATILRPPIVFGPRDRGLLPVFRLAERGLAFLPARLSEVSAIHVDDLVSATVETAERPPRGGPRFYVGAGAHRLQEFVGTVAAAYATRLRTIRVPVALGALAAFASDLLARARGGSPYFGLDKWRESRAPAWTCADDRFREATGWEARRGFEESLRETARWYAEAGWAGDH